MARSIIVGFCKALIDHVLTLFIHLNVLRNLVNKVVIFYPGSFGFTKLASYKHLPRNVMQNTSCMCRLNLLNMCASRLISNFS